MFKNQIILFIIFIAELALYSQNTTRIIISLSELQKEIKQNLQKFNKIPDDIKNLYGLETIDGFFVDDKSYDVIIFGTKGENVLTIDDFVVALRCAAYSVEPPGVSIDPRPKLKDPYKIQDVRFFGPVKDTFFGYTLFESDYFLKKIAANVVNLKVKNFKTYKDLIVEQIKEESKTCSSNSRPKESLNRFWFYPANVLFSKSENNLYLLNSCDVVLLTEKQFFDKKKKEIISLSGETDIEAAQFASDFTNRYSEFASVYFTYKRLQALFRIYAIAKLMAEKQIPADIDYLLDEYPVSKKLCPKKVKGIKVKIEHQHLWEDKKYKYICIHRALLSGGVLIEIPTEQLNISILDPQVASEITTEIFEKIKLKPLDKTVYFLKQKYYETDDIRNGVLKKQVKVHIRPIDGYSDIVALLGDVLEMEVTNNTNEFKKYKLNSGVILKNISSFSQNAVVYKLKGELISPEKYIVTDIIELKPNETKKYLLEVYSINFKKRLPTVKSEFYLTEKEIDAVKKIAYVDNENLSSFAKQIAIWTLVDKVSKQTLLERYNVNISSKDVNQAIDFLKTAGFKKEIKQLE